MSKTDQQLAFRIIKWHERHSNHEQKRSGGRWICCPTSFDSLGLRMLLRKPKGVEAFGVYVLLAELAARMPTPGVLANEEKAFSIEDVEIITGAPAKVLGAALDLLASPETGWVDRVPFPECLRNESGRPPDDDRNGSVPRVRGRGSSSSSVLEPSANAAAAAAAGAGAIDVDRGVLSMLERLDVPPDRIAELVGLPGLRPWHVLAHWGDVSRNPRVRHPGRYVAKRLADDGLKGVPPLDAQVIVEAISGGVVRVVDGRDIHDARISRNSRGIYAEGELIIPADQITEIEFA